jgi:glycerol-3-phosphate O-acyltransferase / dihydroxyacetone phosphate acyltransferase
VPSAGDRMVSRLITKVAGWAVALFYDVERTGPRLVSGPVLVTANHPNALVDPLIIFHTAGRPTRPLAKAPLFEQVLSGLVLKGLGGLPVYRRQDDPELMHLNDRTFDSAIEALQGGGAVQIYPEGQSHSEPSMVPLRTGAARIALMAEDRAGWSVGLRIQPVGLTYERKHLFRGRAIAAFGPPIEISQLRDLYERDEREAVRQLTEAIKEGLAALTLNYDSDRDQELVDVAERVWAADKGLTRPRQRDRMAQRLPRLHRFAEGVRWLEEADPERLADLREAVSRYLRLLTLFGASGGDVPPRYRIGAVIGHSLRQVAMLTLVLPAAVAGAIAWVVPFLFTNKVAYGMRPKHDQIATYKVSVGFLAFPSWLAMVCVVLWFVAGWRAATLAAVVLPIFGLAAIAWRDRQAVVREDFRVFLRARRRSESRDRLAEQRALLVAEFDALAELRRVEGADGDAE